MGVCCVGVVLFFSFPFWLFENFSIKYRRVKGLCNHSDLEYPNVVPFYN